MKERKRIMIFNDKWYDVLKWVATLALPAFITLYALLASTWGWPYAEQITATLAGVNAFLGTLIGVSSLQYKKQQELEKAEDTQE